MLWDKTKQLPKDLLNQVEDIYRKNFPLEVRLHLAAWIEDKCSPTTMPALMPDDPEHAQMAADIANQLMNQLENKITSMPNDPDKFLMKGKLEEIAVNLRVRNIISFHFMHTLLPKFLKKYSCLTKNDSYYLLKGF